MNVKNDTGADNEESKEDGHNATALNARKCLIISAIAKGTAVATRISKTRAGPKGT
jgi:hypothetical protein